MNNFSIITIFPEIVETFCKYGTIKNAIKKKKVKISLFNPRNYSTEKNKKIDDKVYGSSGMLMMFQPLFNTLKIAKKKSNCKKHTVIYLSPQGKLLTQKKVKKFLTKKHIIFICGRYQGVDERFIKTQIHEEWSIGKYILTGGEIPAMVFLETIIRLIPGVLNKESLLNETFQNNLLECPKYTKPKKINNLKVPKILLSGNHKKIEEWKKKKSLEKTIKKNTKFSK